MIEGHCKTNLDIGKHVDWPDSFYVVPQKGDYVESKNGRNALKVCSITHTMREVETSYGKVWKPYIIVELNR